MKILIAPDSFKDALPALEVCQAIERGIKQADTSIETILFPLADGGEGTAAILTHHAQGHWHTLQVHDPLLRPIEAGYGISADGQTAFIEMAQAAGLQLLKPEERNPLKTSTYGVGEMILDAIQKGIKKIVLGIGGSATNDAGIGMAGALEYDFFIDHLPLTINQLAGENLHKIERVITLSPHPPITITVLCDVDNPLYGPSGAAQVYARQKGADEAAIQSLDTGLQHFANILKTHFGRDFAHLPGAGAAGGLGAGTMAFLNATLQPGIQTVMELTNFTKALHNVDLIITGEGKIDAQTLHGKLIKGITEKAQGIPVIALCGTLLASAADIQALGLQAAYSIINRPLSLAEAMAETAVLLEQTAFNLIRTWNH
ncbi:MAG: glycerate kinase [Saprospiraceae bacterium]